MHIIPGDQSACVDDPLSAGQPPPLAPRPQLAPSQGSREGICTVVTGITEWIGLQKG